MKFWIPSRVAPNRSWSMPVSPGRAFDPMGVPSSNVRNEALIEYRRDWKRRTAAEIRCVRPGYRGQILAAGMTQANVENGGGALQRRGPAAPSVPRPRPTSRGNTLKKAAGLAAKTG